MPSSWLADFVFVLCSWSKNYDTEELLKNMISV